MTATLYERLTALEGEGYDLPSHAPVNLDGLEAAALLRVMLRCLIAARDDLNDPNHKAMPVIINAISAARAAGVPEDEQEAGIALHTIEDVPGTWMRRVRVDGGWIYVWTSTGSMLFVPDRKDAVLTSAEWRSHLGRDNP